MSYLVLARKYRPQKFSEVTGQSQVTIALTNAVLRDRVPHALLFSGPRGVGKTSCARILAKVLNCSGREISVENNSIDPCGECTNCVDITRGSNLAVVEIDGASNNSVEDVRHLIETLYTSPPPGIPYKLYIIDEVHMLSTSAFNALLKSIEEPPANTIFILATTEVHKIPDTVRSRCQEHNFRRLLVSDIVSQLDSILKKEGLEVSREVVRILAKAADGGMRDASSLLDRVLSLNLEELTPAYVASVLGTLDASYFYNLIQSIVLEDEGSALEQISFAFSRGLDIRAYLSDFVSSLRSVYLYSLAKGRGDKALARFVELEELSDVEVEFLNNCVENKNSDYFAILFDVGREIAETTIRSEFPQAVMEAGIVKLCFCDHLVSIKESIQGRVQVSNAVPSKREVVLNTGPVSAVESQMVASQDDLSWNHFLSFIKEKGEPLLLTYLNRVAPVEFLVKDGSGHLTVKGTSFVTANFNEKANQESLKSYLSNFSGCGNWRLLFEEVEEGGLDMGSNLVKGSKQALMEDKKRKAFKQIEEEAKNSDAVKNVLDFFQGTKIEKVVPDLGK